MELIKRYRTHFLEDWYQFDGKLFFLSLCFVYLAIFILKRLFVLSEIAAFEVLQERGDMWLFDVLLSFQYASVPIFLLWKFTITAFLLWVGCFMFGYKVTYAQLWRWVMFSELVFILPEVIKLFWLLLSPEDYNYHDIVAFYPLSLMNLFDHQLVEKAYHYPLKAINLFELIYWFMLATGVFIISNKKWSISLLIVFINYVLIFFAWLGYYLLVYK